MADSETLAGLYNAQDSCDPRNHTGRGFGDIFETMFVIAWIQLVPSLLSLLHYLGSIFAKGRDLVCCCESWKKAKIDADTRTEVGDDEPAFIASIMFIYVYLGEQDLDVINTVENFKLFRASVVMEMIISILGIYYVFTMPAVMYYTPRPERGISVLIFNAQINLQLLIYVIMIGWFVLGFVFTYYGFFYTWGGCGYDVADIL